MTFGQYLRATRKKQRLTQEQLAQQAQVSTRAVAYWERDEYTPRSHEVQAVLTALNVPTQEQTSILLSLPPLRGEKLVRNKPELQASLPNLPLPGAGDLLAALRSRRGWTRPQAAEQLRTTTTTLSRWENNRFAIPQNLLPLIQNVLQATDVEIQALRQRLMLALDDVNAPYSPELCEQWVEAFTAELYSPGPHSVDLDAVALQRRLWLSAAKHPGARSALAQVTLYYGEWLVSQDRGKEVPRHARRAFDLYSGEMPQNDTLAAALNLSSWCKAHRPQPQPEQGESFLRQWLPRLSHVPTQIKVTADAALYAAQAGKPDLALSYLEDARRIYELPGQSTEALYRYLQLTSARVLLYNGRPQEAYAALTQIIPASEDNKTDIPLVNALMFAEIMVAAKERSHAAAWLTSIQGRMEFLQAPRLQARADALAQAL